MHFSYLKMSTFYFRRRRFYFQKTPIISPIYFSECVLPAQDNPVKCQKLLLRLTHSNHPGERSWPVEPLIWMELLFTLSTRLKAERITNMVKFFACGAITRLLWIEMTEDLHVPEHNSMCIYEIANYHWLSHRPVRACVYACVCVRAFKCNALHNH